MAVQFGQNKVIQMNPVNSATSGNQSNLNTGLNLEGLGEIPRLSQPPNTYYNTIAQSQYNQQLYKDLSQKPYNQPLIGKSNVNVNTPPDAYNTVIQDLNYTSENPEGQSNSDHNYLKNVKEFMNLEGRTPLCKAFTYVNIILGLIIFYMFIKSY